MVVPCRYRDCMYILFLSLALLISNVLDNPSTGEVRLYSHVNSPSSYFGLVEVYLSEEWGTVADDSWTIEDGEVVCRELGFEIYSKFSNCLPTLTLLHYPLKYYFKSQNNKL